MAWGTAGNDPAPGDCDGDGDTDAAVYRPSLGVWFVPGAASGVTAWGTAGDEVLPLTPSVRTSYFPPG